MFCSLCEGKGKIYDFQRKLLQTGEDSGQNQKGDEIYPLRFPVLEPVKVERLLPDYQGGIKQYGIHSFSDEVISIEGNDLPLESEKKRVSYYFDRFTKVEAELLSVENGVLRTSGTWFNDKHNTGNDFNVHGDIVLIDRLYKDDSEYTQYSFDRNIIRPGWTGDLSGIRADYYYCPPAKVLTADIESKYSEEKWTHSLLEGTCRIAVEPWYELAKGDIITLLTPTLYKNEVRVHNTDLDTLFELDIFNIDDVVFDEDGNKYEKGTDFSLMNYNQLVWTDNQPAAGKKISTRYGYHPSYVVFNDNPIPNTLENKRYPKIVHAKYWSKTDINDVKRAGNVL